MSCNLSKLISFKFIFICIFSSLLWQFPRISVHCDAFRFVVNRVVETSVKITLMVHNAITMQYFSNANFCSQKKEIKFFYEKFVKYLTCG